MGDFSFGQRVRIRAGKYTGCSGTVIDSDLDSEILPPPAPGFYWVRIDIHTFMIPVHVHGDDIEPE
jgi:hypothetical protein